MHVILWLFVVAPVWLWGCSRTQTDLPVQAIQPLIVALPAVEVTQEEIPPKADIQGTPAAAPLSPMVHEVKWQHETFYAISRWYTGSGQNWRRLVEANPDIHPQRIRIGQTILIPNELLKTHQPMPAGHLRPSPAQKKPAPRQRSEPSPKVAAPLLYGPIHSATQPLPMPLETID